MLITPGVGSPITQKAYLLKQSDSMRSPCLASLDHIGGLLVECQVSTGTCSRRMRNAYHMHIIRRTAAYLVAPVLVLCNSV